MLPGETTVERTPGGARWERLTREDHPLRRRFADFAALPDEDIDLAEAALVIAAEEYDGLDVAAQLARLDDLADDAEPLVDAEEHPMARVQVLTSFLYAECGFRGNDDDYYDPRNSYLNDVLDRRLGIPISLAIVTLAVAERIGIPLEGVGFPAHFLVRHATLPGVYVDPFRGRLLGIPDCRSLLERASAGRIPFHRSLLEPVSNRQILARSLNNLKAIYTARRDWSRAIATCDRILLLQPGSPAHRRDRGLLYLEAGAVRLAVADLDAYLDRAPGATDWAAIRTRADRARTRAARLD